MQLIQHPPSEELRPYIKSYKIVESPRRITNRVLPQTSFSMVIRYRGEISCLNGANGRPLEPAIFSGLQRSARIIHYSPGTSAIIIVFTETGLPAFFRRPLHELFGRSVPLEEVFTTPEVAALQDQFTASRSHARRIESLERFLMQKLTGVRNDKLISIAIDRIYATGGNIRIKALIKELYVSQDTFEKRFRKTTGATPKQFSHIVKMNSAISRYKSVPRFADLAFENGYYDQSHFNKDFKLFTGQTPTDFFQSPRFW